jgi:hypothetical protein
MCILMYEIYVHTYNRIGTEKEVKENDVVLVTYCESEPSFIMMSKENVCSKCVWVV